MNKILVLITLIGVMMSLYACGQNAEEMSEKKAQKELSDKLMEGYDDWDPGDPAFEEMPEIK
ncbi:hypothetical protein INT08_10380 [Prosthecochloris sp. N3]|uniref:Secreted protein n=1 Tax=Prosthecochloris ethylica TaxID=2743976 RepID=A0ABR9XU38_9CHLB|nr:hypothetical protein [Prosthecochloris ethylica]MBF0587330.1 hypothetical protein [Prosthecochloris ethylica]MBF0637575.1 hypothetical protein [Prosthecochloris ethylica]NUK48283.1 hypothetical protein [Prosthecochloris ethylica]